MVRMVSPTPHPRPATTPAQRYQHPTLAHTTDLPRAARPRRRRRWWRWQVQVQVHAGGAETRVSPPRYKARDRRRLRRRCLASFAFAPRTFVLATAFVDADLILLDADTAVAGRRGTARRQGSNPSPGCPTDALVVGGVEATTHVDMGLRGALLHSRMQWAAAEGTTLRCVAGTRQKRALTSRRSSRRGDGRT